MTITTVHEYKTKLTVDSQNDIVCRSLVLVISLQKFSNKSYY